MTNFTFRGHIAAVFTAFNDDLTINTDIIPKYAKFLADAEIHGLLVLGTTGEAVSLNVEERKIVMKAWAEAVKQTKQHLMVQVGGCPLPDVLELARYAEKIGVDSLLCLPELYFKPATSQELVDYLKIVGKAAPKTPLIYYHNPGQSSVHLNMADFLKQVGDQIPTFRGLKYTSNDLNIGYNALKVAGDKFTVLIAADTLLAAAFTLGFDSSICTSFTILPQYGVNILKAIKASNVEEARKIQDKLTAACNIITKDGTWVPTMKAAMNLLTPFNVGPVRPPLKDLTPAQIKDMEIALKKCL